MTRKIGGHVSTTGGLNNAIRNTLEIEGNCMQFFAGSPRSWARRSYSNEEADEFLRGIEKNKLSPVFIHALYLINLATTADDLLEKSISSLVSDLENGKRIKSAGVIIHIGSHQGRGFDSISGQLIKVLELILSRTSSTPLILENDAGQQGKIGSLEEINFLIDKIRNPRLKVCLDTAHLFEAGFNFTLELGLQKLIALLTDLNLSDKLACIHLNDSATDLDSHRDMHANLGQGKIGMDGLRKIANARYFSHLPLILEVPGENKQGPDKENILKAQSLISNRLDR